MVFNVDMIWLDPMFYHVPIYIHYLENTARINVSASSDAVDMAPLPQIIRCEIANLFFI